MIKTMRAGTIVLSLLLAVGVNVAHGAESKDVDRRVERLLKQMTLE